jgi:GH15 family glucan-1,4-alpha-glucosidase
MPDEALQPGIADYAVIGDCHTIALISRQGSLDWLCLPDFDDPAYFSRLLDMDKGGRFSIGCRNARVVTRRYLPDTAILETVFTSDAGILKLTDCMVVQPNGRRSRELLPLREVLRRVEVVEGAPEIEVDFSPRPDYGRKSLSLRSRGAAGWSLNHRNACLNLLSDFPLAPSGNALKGVRVGQRGEKFYFSLTFDPANPAVHVALGPAADERMAMARRWWEYWAGEVRYSGPHAAMVRRSAITLRLLTYPLSGALVAAATTSLPEKAGGDYNWDYRYCWPRDAALAICAFLDIGLHRESDAFFNWLGLAAGLSPHLKSVYDIHGRRAPPDKELKDLAGHRGAWPVRIGNSAGSQLQHDVYGEIMLAVSESIDRGYRDLAIDPRILARLGNRICETWRLPDNGIWELPDRRRHYTYSKVMAWYTLDRLIAMHRREILDIPLDRYLAERERLREEIERHGFNTRLNCYVNVFDGDEVDASLLLLPRCGFVAHGDPRMHGTWDAIRRHLDRDGLIFRFQEDTAFGLKGEGAFTICGFWAVEYLAALGEAGEARRRLDRLIGCANDLGLFSEGYDLVQGACGNFPQAFSHTGFINAVIALEKPALEKAA